MMRINSAHCNFEREPLRAPFGFKGGYLSELWQTIVRLGNCSGNSGAGLGTQSVLWSDSDIFTDYPEAVGNSMMFLTTANAVEQAKTTEWRTPMELLDSILPHVYSQAKTITRSPELRLTFVLNALVALDNAAWQLHCRENQLASFDDMLAADFKPALAARHTHLACIPLMSYNVPLEKIVEAVENGYFFLKIKIGADPEGDGDRGKMLEWDKNWERMESYHPCAGASWTKVENGLFTLDSSFYEKSGGIFMDSFHWSML